MKKQIALFLGLLLFAASLNAQIEPQQANPRHATAELSALRNLDGSLYVGKAPKTRLDAPKNKPMRAAKAAAADAEVWQTWQVGSPNAADITATLMDDGTLTFTGSGAMLEYSLGSTPWYPYSNYLTSVVIEEGITTMCFSAFVQCYALQSLSLPNSLTAIPMQAFWECPLTNITIPEGVTTIGQSAFNGCANLIDITLPEGLKSIGLYAFARCESLTDITLPDGLTTIESQAFSDCSRLANVTLPNGSVTVGSSVFWGCTNLTNITLPNGFAPVNYTLLQSSSIANINVAADHPTLTSVDGVLFSKDKTKLVLYPYARTGAYTIPANVTTLGEYAFYGNPNLEQITIGSAITTIEMGALAACPKLSINVDAGNTAFALVDGVLFSKDLKTLVQYPIGKEAEAYTVPDGVSAIADEAFNGSAITAVTFPESLTTIGDYAFQDCNGLEDITLGSSITTLGDGAFYYCAGLTKVVCLNPTPPALGGTYVFSGVPAFIEVPEGSVAAYKAAWPAYANLIMAIDGLPTWDCGAEGNNVTATLENGTLTISGTGKMKDSINASGQYLVISPWNSVSASITAVVVGEGVSYIGVGAFLNHVNLTSVTLPQEGLDSIGRGTFDGCTSLTSITLPEGLERIGNFAFRGSQLTTVTLPKSLIYLGDNAFFISPNGTLETVISLNPTPPTIGAYPPFIEEHPSFWIEVPESSVAAYKEAWSRYENYIGAIGAPHIPTWECGDQGDNVIATLSNDTLYIEGTGEMADYYDEEGNYGTSPWYSKLGNITTVVVGNGVTSIGDGAFLFCDGLTSVALPEGLESIGALAFRNCPLTVVTLPESLRYIGANAFYRYPNPTLEAVVSLNPVPPVMGSADSPIFVDRVVPGFWIEVPEGSVAAYKAAWAIHADYIGAIGAPHIGGEWECGAEDDNVMARLSNDTLYINGTGMMANYFDEATSSRINDPWSGQTIRTVVIGDGVTYIGADAFYNYTNIQSVVFPESMDSIGNYAFYGCSGLTSVSLPEGLITIGHSAFRNCSLTTVTVPQSVTTINSNAFANNLSLETVISLNPVPPTEYRSFNIISSEFKIIVPDGSVDAYKAAWVDYVDYIQGGDLGLLAMIDSLQKENDALKADTATLKKAMEDAELDFSQTIAGMNQAMSAMGQNLTKTQDTLADVREELEALTAENKKLKDSIDGLHELLADCGSAEQLLQDSVTKLNALIVEWIDLNDQLLDSIDGLYELLEACNGEGSANANLIPQEQITVSPNPVNYELKITNYEFKSGDVVELFDMSGKRVYHNSQFSTLNGVNSQFTIDMSPYQSGNYILRIGNRVAKIVKQ
ncbi:MAG: leucine-rich repeat protein [Bacteroidales bacterium]|jgi:hypothetical protein|nr:leucine-rich repeat protein [Bacteroidales bacterium]